MFGFLRKRGSKCNAAGNSGFNAFDDVEMVLAPLHRDRVERARMTEQKMPEVYQALKATKDGLSAEMLAKIQAADGNKLIMRQAIKEHEEKWDIALDTASTVYGSTIVARVSLKYF